MVRLIAFIERDLKKFKRNPLVIGISIFMPILYLLIIGNAFQGKLQGLPVVVVNQDSGPHSRRLMENLRSIQAGPKTLTLVTTPQDEREALEGVREGRYKGGLIIPPDFSKRIELNSRPEVGLFLDNTDGISSQAIQGAIAGALGSIYSDYVPIRERTDQIFLRNVELYRKVDYYQSLVPGVVIMAIFLGVLTTGAFNLVMDRFLGVDECYLLTPLSKSDIVAGLIISGLSITLLIAFLIFSIGMIITGIPFSFNLGQLASLLLIVVLTILSLLSLMFVILGRIKHPRIVGALSGFMNIILFFPSGAIYPVASFPNWLKIFTKINPEAYAVDALKAILFKGANLGSILTGLTFLSVFTLVMMTVAIGTFKRTL